MIQAAIQQGISDSTLVEQDSDVNEFVTNITEPAANPIEENVVVEKRCSELEEDDSEGSNERGQKLIVVYKNYHAKS